MSAPRLDVAHAVAAHVQEALSCVLLSRPERPVEFMAEYFRAAAAQEALAAAPTAAASPSPQQLGVGASTPLTRALILLRSSSGAAVHAPHSFAAAIASAFDELATGGADGGLLGSLLLQRPKSATAVASAMPGVPTVQLRSTMKVIGGAPPARDEESASATAGVDPDGLSVMLQRLFEHPGAASITTVDEPAVPVDADLARELVAALMEGATGSSSIAAAAAAGAPVPFEPFARAMRDQRRLALLHDRLIALMMAVVGPPSLDFLATDAGSGSASESAGASVLAHLHSSALSLADATELVALMLRSGQPSSAAEKSRSNRTTSTNTASETAAPLLSESQAATLLSSFRSLLSPSVPRASTTAGGSAASLSSLEFVRAVMRSAVDEMRARREAKESAATRLAQQSLGGAVDSRSDSALHRRPPPSSSNNAAVAFSPSLASVYARAFDHNPSAATAASSLRPPSAYEHVETVEYS